MHCSTRIQVALRFCLVLATAIFLSSCVNSTKYWDEFVSSGETMKLFTFVNCTNKPNEWPQHQIYHHAGYFSEGWNGGYFAKWVDTNRKEDHDMLFVSLQWNVGLRNYTKLNLADPQKWLKNPRCGAVIQLPWSSDEKRPFASGVTPQQLTFEARAAAVGAGMVGFVVAAAFLITGTYAIVGYVGAPIDRGPLAGLFLVVVFAISTVAWFDCASVFENIERLRSYYVFFDGLPKDIWGHLLPLSWWQVQRLVTGPPLPTETVPTFGSFYTTVAVGLISWSLLFGRDILIGMYCVHRDPFASLRAKASQQGVPPTPEEVMDILAQASLGASTLEIEAVARRARALNWEK